MVLKIHLAPDLQARIVDLKIYQRPALTTDQRLNLEIQPVVDLKTHYMLVRKARTRLDLEIHPILDQEIHPS